MARPEFICDVSKIIFFANTDWYLWNFRRSLALAAQAAGYEVLLVSPVGDYGQRFSPLGLKWRRIKMERRSLNVFHEVAVLWRLFRMFRHERPTIVHGFTLKCAIYAGLAGRAAGVPVRVAAVTGLGYVFTSQDLRARLLRPVVKWMLRLSLGGKNAKLILQNSDDQLLFLNAGLVAPNNIRLIQGSGVDCARFTLAPDGARGTAAPPVVLLAARLLWDKGIHEYVDAARALRARGVRARFLLAGTADTGNPAAVPEAAIRQWVRAGLVEWLGHVDDMVALFRSVDIVALPSYREGLPKSLIEAAACELALVTSDAPGCREVVDDGVNGLLVAPRNAHALAAALERLITSRELRLRLGRAARAKALAQFDEKIVIAKTLAVYQEAA